MKDTVKRGDPECNDRFTFVQLTVFLPCSSSKYSSACCCPFSPDSRSIVYNYFTKKLLQHAVLDQKLQ